MAAVMALIFVPLLATFGVLMTVTGHDHSIVSMVAMLSFIALGVGMLYGTLKFIKNLEPPEPHA